MNPDDYRQLHDLDAHRRDRMPNHGDPPSRCPRCAVIAHDIAASRATRPAPPPPPPPRPAPRPRRTEHRVDDNGVFHPAICGCRDCAALTD